MAKLSLYSCRKLDQPPQGFVVRHTNPEDPDLDPLLRVSVEEVQLETNGDDPCIEPEEDGDTCSLEVPPPATPGDEWVRQNGVCKSEGHRHGGE